MGLPECPNLIPYIVHYLIPVMHFKRSIQLICTLISPLYPMMHGSFLCHLIYSIEMFSIIDFWLRNIIFRILITPISPHQSVVEKRLLRDQRRRRQDLSREEFLQEVWTWKSQWVLLPPHPVLQRESLSFAFSVLFIIHYRKTKPLSHFYSLYSWLFYNEPQVVMFSEISFQENHELLGSGDGGGGGARMWLSYWSAVLFW